MQYLKQSTAVTIPMGPFVDSTDGNTQETGLTIAQADIRLSKNGGAYAQTNNVAGATHMEAGKYGVPLNTTDTATLGRLRVDIHVTGALAVWDEFLVIPAHIYNTLVLGSDKLEVDLVQMNNDTQSLADLKDFADAGYDPATNKVQGVILADTVTTLTGHTAQTGDNYVRLGAPAAASIAADLQAINNFVDELETRLTATRAGYLDNLSAGAVALASGVDLTKIHGSALTETIGGYLAAAFVKLFDVTTPLLVASTVMRGTDNAALASVCTEARLAELAAANLPADIDAILADVTGINGDTMRGTNSAALASVCTEGRLAELAAANIPADIDTLLTRLSAIRAGYLDELAAANLPADIDAILADTGTDGVVVASGSKTGYALSTAGVTAITGAIKVMIIEGTITFEQGQRIILAGLAGKSAGGGTATLTFRDIADSKDRISATVDANGNRTAITVDGV